MPSTSHREAYLERIISAQSAIVQANLDLDRFMQLIVDTVQDLTLALGAVIELVDGDCMVYRCASGIFAPHVGLRLKRTGSLSGLCVESNQILRCDDAETDPRVDLAACHKVGVQSMVCAPLLRSGEPVGVLKVMAATSHYFDPQDEQTLTLLSGVLGAALGKQLIFDALEETEARLRLTLENAHDAVISVNESGLILRWNRAAEKLFGWTAQQVVGQQIGELTADGHAFLAEIFDEYHSNPALFQFDLRQEFELTLPDGQTKTVEYNIGCNQFENGKELTAFLHDVSLRKSLENAMRDVALTDGLTGLPNRRRVVNELHGAILRHRRQPHSMALLFLDMNGFKQINDSFGHAAGDRALQEFARRVRSCVRESDLVGRLGGDEFIVMLEGTDKQLDAVQVAEKIITTIEQPIAGVAFKLGTSIGICLYKAGWDQDEWLKRADEAMYAAKKRHAATSRLAIYDASVSGAS